MKIAVTKEALLEGLQRIQNVVSTRPTLPVLTNVLLEADESGVQLTTTDLEVGIRCRIDARVEKPGATTLPARKLVSIIRELPTSEITIDVDSKNISSIRCGSSFFKIYGLPREEFPALWPVIADSSDKKAADAFGLSGYPYFVLVDAQGKMFKRLSGEIPMDELTTIINQLIVA